MALFNHATKEVTAKLVYYGPGLCGKTTNLQWIHGNLSFKTKGKLVSLATQTDRTLFFDFLPIELGTIRGMRTRMQIYTVPGQVFYESTRRMVLKGCDAVVFVADSQAAMLDANAESLRSLRQNLLVNEIDPEVPQVLQYNKRDLPTALPISVLNERLNPRNLPYFEAVAFKGIGVEDTLKGVTKQLFQWLSRYYGESDAAAAAAAAEGIGVPGAGREPAPVKVTVRVPHATVRIQPEEAEAPKTSPPTPVARPAPVAARPPVVPPSAVETPPATSALTPPAAPPVAAPPPVAARAPQPPPATPVVPAHPAPAPQAPAPPAVSTRPTPPSAPAPVAPPRPAPPAPAPPAVSVRPAPVPPAPVPPAPVPPAPVPPAPTPPVVAARPAAPAPPTASARPTPQPSAPPAPVAPSRPSQVPPAPTPPVVSARPAAPAPPPAEGEIPSTIVFAKQRPTAPPTTPPAIVIPAPTPTKPVPTTVAPPAAAAVIKPQPVVIPSAARVKPAATATAPSMNVPPPMPAGARFEAPRPAAPEPSVFREPSKPAAPTDPLPKGDGLRGDQWLYLLDGAQRGPIDVEDLIDLVLTSIPENTKVWHPGLDGWVRADQLRDIADEIPPPLPIPGAQRGYVEEDMPDFNTVPPMLRTVLIADEDAAFRKYLAMPLAAQGFTIYEAADGSAAWQLAVQNRPWMILADISMPEVDGFEFCRRVRNHPLLSRMPLLFISGSDKYKERYRALQIGADDFLSKNMPIRELLMRIQLLMTRYSDLSGGEQKPGTADVAGAFQGRIEVFGAPALLQMCSQGRLTGLFTALAEDASNTATVMGFREGDIISATAGATTGADGVYAFLGWEKGSFKFTPGDPGAGDPLAQSVEHLLLEGCRILDESRKDEGDGARVP
jgi:CheY-like chemotaxis protein/signal recognition particle receptor subunit beta